MAGTSNLQQSIAQAKEVKQKYEDELLHKKNVIGVGIGFRSIAGAMTDEVAIVVNVKHKANPYDLNDDDFIPTRLDDVAVDVIEVGNFRMH